MSLFGFGKKKETEEKAPCCGCSCSAQEEPQENCCAGEKKGQIFEIKVLGSGCKSCHALYENAKKAAEDLGLAVEVEYVTDMEKVMAYGVMQMPALVVNGRVAAMGKVLSPAQVAVLLQ